METPMTMPPELIASLALQKKVAELEKETKQLQEKLERACIERDLAKNKLAELERAALAARPAREGESLLQVIQSLSNEHSAATEEMVRLKDKRRSVEQRHARWQQLLERALALVSGVNAESAHAAMALAATCTDHLLREEEERYARLCAAHAEQTPAK
jgi:predicted  nucleic acid-binding Zn-ribbon protein